MLLVSCAGSVHWPTDTALANEGCVGRSVTASDGAGRSEWNQGRKHVVDGGGKTCGAVADEHKSCGQEPSPSPHHHPLRPAPALASRAGVAGGWWRWVGMRIAERAVHMYWVSGLVCKGPQRHAARVRGETRTGTGVRRGEAARESDREAVPARGLPALHRPHQRLSVSAVRRPL